MSKTSKRDMEAYIDEHRDASAADAPENRVNAWKVRYAVNQLVNSLQLNWRQEPRNYSQRGKSTNHTYASACRTLLKRGHDLTGSVSWEGAVTAFETMPVKTLSTWGLRKSALREAIRILQLPASLDARLVILQPPADIAAQRVFDSRCLTGMDPIVRGKIVDWLEGAQGRYRKSSIAAVALIQAGVLVGLRPQEWRTARLDKSPEGMIELKVQTLKKRTSDSPMRTLILDDFNEYELGAVRRAIEIVQDLKFDWSKMYALIQKAIRQACIEIWGKDFADKYTLYNTRHQFAANAKAAYKNDFEAVAALLGHEEPGMARRYSGKELAEYGKDWPGGVIVVVGMPVPSPEDIDNLRSRRQRRSFKRQEKRLENRSEQAASVMPAPSPFSGTEQ